MWRLPLLLLLPLLVAPPALAGLSELSNGHIKHNWLDQPRTCDQNDVKDAPFCDHTRPIDERVQDLISRMSQNDKLGQFINNAPAAPSVQVNAYEWWSEALHGVGDSPGVNFTSGELHAATSFPQPAHSAASLNRTLWAEIGKAVGTEARVFYNKHQAGGTFWTPNINIFRDPRWGRGQETPGEDPFVTATYAKILVENFQDTGSASSKEDPNRPRVAACCKHYYAYSVEGSSMMEDSSLGDMPNRHSFNALITPQDEADTYLPMFESCVRDTGIQGLMCSYNAVNGVPSCANKRIMDDIARGQWGFDGYITSDCGAVYDVLANHKYTYDANSTIRAVFEAGMDTDCGFPGVLAQKNMEYAVESGELSMKEVNLHLARLFTIRMRLGEFDPLDSQNYVKNYNADKVDTGYHRMLALAAANQGVTLLKNDGALPLDVTKTNIFVTGANANNSIAMLGNYFGQPPYITTPLNAIRRMSGGRTTFAQGCMDAACANNSMIPRAAMMAKAAGAAVVIVGLGQDIEAEGKDRLDIKLPGYQHELVEKVSQAAKKTIVVVMTGGVIDISAIKDNPNVNAILRVGYCGQSCGEAIAATIAGFNNPGGRLLNTWYPAEYIDQVEMGDMYMRPHDASPGRTYRFYEGTPIYSFGYGLSYSTIVVKNKPGRKINVPVERIKPFLKRANSEGRYHRFGEPLAKITMEVENTSTVDAPHYSVLCFVAPPGAGENGTPKTKLVGFEKVSVPAGATVTVTFDITAMDLAVPNADGQWVHLPGKWDVLHSLDEPSIGYISVD